MKLSIQLLTYNGEKYLTPLFESLKKQTCTDWELFVLDNNSADRTATVAEKLVAEFSLPATVIRNTVNTGFARGNNILFQKSAAPYVLLINQDAFLKPDCLEKMVSFMETHHAVAALSPRVMKWNFEQHAFTDIVDSLGMKVFKSRRVIDIAEGEAWTDEMARQRGEWESVFGVSAGCVMYRKSALDAVAYPDGGFFDSAYFMYKEDVDLAYRLQMAGYEAAVLYTAVAYHARTTGRSGGLDDETAAQNKKKQNAIVRYESYKNHLMNLWKNEIWQNVILDLPWILWYEGKKFAYFVLCDWKVLRGLPMVWKRRSARQSVQNKRTVGWRQMRKWFNTV